MFVILYSLQCKIEGHAVYKKYFNIERSKGIFVRKNLKSIVKKMCSALKVPQCITKGVVAIICSNSFSHCKGDLKKIVAISQMFNHVQLRVHWMHLLNTRICRYTCIYITPTVQTLHYCSAGA